MPHIPIEPGSESRVVIAAIRAMGEELDHAARRNLAADKMRVWQNDFSRLVESDLADEMGAENYRELRPFISTVNVMEKVVRKVAINYDRPARRLVARPTVTSPEPVEQEPEEAAAGVETEEVAATADAPPEGQAGLDFVLSFEDRDALMAEVERLTMFQEAVWVVAVVRPHPVTGLPRLEHDIITPAIGDVVLDPADQTRAVGYYWTQKEYVGAELREVVRYYDAVQWLKFVGETGELLAAELHGFGRAPVSVFRRGRPVDSYYYRGAGDDLFLATKEVSIMRTFLSRAFRISSWKQAFVAGQLDERTKASEILSPYRPIEGGSNSSVQTFGLGPEGGLRDHLEAIRAWEDEIASKHGLPPHVYRGISDGGGPLSGAALKMAMSEALRQARERRKYLVEGELDLLDADRAVLERHGMFQAGQGLAAGTPIIVDPQEPDFAPSPQEQRDDDDWHIAHGTRSVIEVMRRENPDLSDAEAERLLGENRRTNRRFGAGQREAGPAVSPFARLGLT